MATVKIIMISFVGFFVGSAVLFGLIRGPHAIIASPFLGIFGWFYLFPILLGVTALWSVYEPARRGCLRTWSLIAAGSLGGCVLMMLIGVRGPEPFWFRGYALGGLVAGGVCAAMVVWMKRTKTEANAKNRRPIVQ